MNLLDNKVHDRILEKKKKLDAYRPLPPPIVCKVQQEMETEYIYNSNAIEGNTLQLRETQLVLEEGITIGGKSLREHLEVRNHPGAIKYIEKLTNSSLTKQNILDLHRIIMKNIVDDAGKFRRTEVRIAGAYFMPPPAYEVSKHIQEMVEWYNKNPDELRPIELASILHHKFVSIHPFRDGNGRIGRLLMNMALIRYHYPIAIVLNVDRKKYYDVLKKADYGEKVPLVNFIAATVERSLNLYLRAVMPTERGDKLLTLAEASKRSRFSQEYLSLLARKRRLDAIKIGRKWMITKRALDRYLNELQKA
jgi:excisionase family DNA binding protein